MIVDTSVLLAYFDREEPDHDDCRRLIDNSEDELVVSPFVIAEVDYMVASRFGVERELIAVGALCGGAWTLATMSQDDLGIAVQVIERYRDQEVGVTDASLVVLADRYRTRTIATLDRRHFGVLRPLSGGRFRVVP